MDKTQLKPLVLYVIHYLLSQGLGVDRGNAAYSALLLFLSQ